MTNALLVDYSFARPDLDAVKAAGYTGVLRYGSHTPAKNISGVEAAGILLRGLDLSLVWETTANRVLSGYAGGFADGQAAKALGDGIGYTGLWYWAVDFDLQPSEYDVAEQYGLGFAAGLGVAKAETGPYGGLAFVEEMLARGFGIAWQTVAWSHGKVSTLANLYQRLSPTIGQIPGTDEDVTLKDQWGQAGAGAVVPTTPENTSVPSDQPASDGQRLLYVAHPFLTGDDVKAQQEFINNALHLGLTVDGVYGPATAAGISTLQSGGGLVADGIVGPATRAYEAAIIAWVSSLPAAPAVPDFPGYIRYHDVSPAVGAFQQRLIDRGYGVGATGADDKYGPATLSALERFQTDAGITVDGIGGPVTWTRLWT